MSLSHQRMLRYAVASACLAGLWATGGALRAQGRMAGQPGPTTQPALSATQPTLLATQPTTAAAPAQPQTFVAKPAPASSLARRARVGWMDGMLTIDADNSSLNGILREIARQTGMTIAGGVADERVFGHYGPADPGTVLAELLMGTGSNLLLEQGSAGRPMELTLSPRQGGVSPPGPQSYTAQEERDPEDLPPRQVRPVPPAAVAAPVAPASAGQPPAAGQPVGVTAKAAETSAPAAAASTAQSPNGVKTPQQIYDQLMKMQQQKSATGANPPQ